MIYRISRPGLKKLVFAVVILGVVWSCWPSFVCYKSVLSSNPQRDLERLHAELANKARLFATAELVIKTSQHRQTNKDTKATQLPTTAESPKNSFQHNKTIKDTKPTQLPTTLTSGSTSTFNKHKSTLVTRTTCGQHYFLLILVSSAPFNVQRRKDIRRTWGVDTAINYRWKTVFLVAKTRNESKSDLLLQENDAFGDLVRADFFEHYWNQTLKIQMGFEWAARYCNFSFLLKADDDVFVNPKGLIALLKDPNTPPAKLYMGELYTNNKPFRGGKWKVSYKEYNKTDYPDFCPGFGIVLSTDVVHLFVDLFEVIPKFRLDDVYIGMLAEKAGVKPVNNAAFSVTEPSISCVPNKQFLVWHGVTGECLFKLSKHI